MSLPPPYPGRKSSGPPPRPPAIPKRKLEKPKEIQELLLDVKTDWASEWKGMPEFVSEEKMPFHTVYVHFASMKDIKDFSERIGIKINTEIKDVKYTPRLWFPPIENLSVTNLRYKSDKK